LSHTKTYEEYVNQFKQWEADVNTRRRGILGPAAANDRPTAGARRQPNVNVRVRRPLLVRVHQGAARGGGTPPVDISESSDDDSDAPPAPRRRRRSRSRDSTPPPVRKEIRNGQAISFNISGATNQPADRRAVLPIGVSNYDMPRRARTPERPQQQLVDDYNESMQQQQHRQRQAQRQAQAAQQIKAKMEQQAAHASLADQYRQHEQMEIETQQQQQASAAQPQGVADTITANDGTSIRKRPRHLP